jgi:ATP-dependent DNA helicase RecG
MDEKQVLEIVKSGETQTVEFKRAVTKDFGKTMCAFANAGGGTIFVGVEDNKVVSGLKSDLLDEFQQQIYHAQQECVPNPLSSITPVVINSLTVLVVRVPKLATGICYYRNEIYVRVGTTDHRISGPAIEDFLKKRQVLSFEEETTNAVLHDLDVDKIGAFLAKRNPGIPFEKSKLATTLVTLRVAVSEPEFHLKKSAILLFGKNPSQFIPQNQVKLARFKGKIAVDILDTTTRAGTLTDNVIESTDFILRHIKKTPSITSLKREDMYEYPLVALREALTNAIAHRDYYSSAATQINIFDDRIEISNPGALPRELKVDDLPFLGLGIPRNPTIYQLLHDAGMVEGLGTGFPRMFQAMRSAGLPDPKPEDYGTIFKLTLYNATQEKIGGLNDRQRRAITYLQEHKTITTMIYEKFCKVSKPTAIQDLDVLVKQGILKKKGKARSTHYIYNQNTEKNEP